MARRDRCDRGVLGVGGASKTLGRLVLTGEEVACLLACLPKASENSS